jgi:hypothetical protein
MPKYIRTSDEASYWPDDDAEEFLSQEDLSLILDKLDTEQEFPTTEEDLPHERHRY